MQGKIWKLTTILLIGIIFFGITIHLNSKNVSAETTYPVPAGFMDYKDYVNYGKVEDITYYSDATESYREAKVLLPASYDKEKRYPVLYIIHGLGDDHMYMLNNKVNWVIDNAVDEGVAKEMIVVFPNACATKTGKPPADFYSLEHFQAYDNFLYDLTENLMCYIEEHYSIRKGREYTGVCGFSMGGRTSLYIGFTRPDLFGYIGGFCPAPGIFEYTHYGVYETGLFTEDTFTLPEEYKNDTFIEIMTGVNDTAVKEVPKTYHEVLEANGVPHIWYTTHGGDIVNPGDGGHTAPTYKHGIYQFLKQMSGILDELEKPIPIELPYEDVAQTDWFYNAVEYTYIHNLMIGMDEKTFGPYGTLSRAQFALILHRMEGETKVETDKKFGDIAGNEWYGPAVLWAAENGIVTGYTNGNFGPVDLITREQMAVMMYRYAKYLGQDITVDAAFDEFKDAAKVSEFAINAMKWAVGNGIMAGKDDGTTLDPQGNTARSEAAIIIERFMK